MAEEVKRVPPGSRAAPPVQANLQPRMIASDICSYLQIWKISSFDICQIAKSHRKVLYLNFHAFSLVRESHGVVIDGAADRK